MTAATLAGVRRCGGSSSASPSAGTWRPSTQSPCCRSPTSTSAASPHQLVTKYFLRISNIILHNQILIKYLRSEKLQLKCFSLSFILILLNIFPIIYLLANKIFKTNLFWKSQAKAASASTRWARRRGRVWACPRVTGWAATRYQIFLPLLKIFLQMHSAGVRGDAAAADHE